MRIMEEEESSKELPSSRLGTKDHWDATYAKELKNFHENGDSGEIWFSLSCQTRLVNWVKNNVSSRETKILDIGCGNGALLIELAEDGFTELTGIDYSSAAVKLAKQVAERDLHSHNIHFMVVDVLDLERSWLHQTTFDLCLDKGTYDAISLDPLGAEEKRSKYIQSVTSLLANGGVFLITSCNWTREELTQHFGQKLSLKAVVPAPTLQFGGKTGQTVTTLALQKHS